MAGELPLRRNGQATVRMYVIAAFVGGAIAPSLVAGWSVLLKLGLFLPAEHGGVARGPWTPLVLFGAVFACVACGVITWMRQPKGARIAWDDWGITEWDGDGARVAIEWSQVHVNTGFTALRTRHGGSTVAGAVLSQGDLPQSDFGGHTIGGQLTLTDPIGRRIDLTQGTQNVTLNDRLTSVDGLGALVSLVENRPRGMARLQPRSENVAAFGILLGILGYVGSFGGLVGFSAQPSEAAAALVLLGGSFLMLRSIAFFRAARRDRMLGAISKVELRGGGPSGTAVLSDGRTVDVAKHLDAGLHLRRGSAWLSSTGALETEGMRAARTARRRSNLASAFGRLLLGAAVFACGAPTGLAFLNAHTHGSDDRVTVIWRADEGAGGADLDTIGRRFLVLEDGHARLLNLDTGALIAELPTKANCWTPRSFALSATHALISCDEHQATLFALESPPREVARIPGELSFEGVALGTERFALGDSSGLTSFGSVSDGKPVGIVQAAGNDGAQVIELCEAGDQIAFITLMRNEWKTWLAKGAVTRRLEEVQGRGESLAFSPDCAVLAVAEEDEVVLIDTSDGKRRDALPSGAQRTLTRTASSMAFSPDGNRLAIATEGKLRVYDLTSRELELEIPLTWRRSLIIATNDEPAALKFDGNETVYVLARYRGVLVRVSLK